MCVPREVAVGTARMRAPGAYAHGCHCLRSFAGTQRSCVSAVRRAEAKQAEAAPAMNRHPEVPPAQSNFGPDCSEACSAGAC